MSKENYLSRDDLLELAKHQAATISLLIFEQQDQDEEGVTAKDLDAAQARIEELERDLRKQQDAYNMQQGDVKHNQRRINELRKELENNEVRIFKAHAETERLEGDLAQARSRNKKFEETCATLRSEISHYQSKLEGERSVVTALKEQLDAAKDARNKAQQEAHDLRAWLRGLVKAGNEVGRPKDYVLQLKEGSIIFKGNGDSYTVDSTQRWFDPGDVFEAYDAEYKRMADENSVQG